MACFMLLPSLQPRARPLCRCQKPARARNARSPRPEPGGPGAWRLHDENPQAGDYRPCLCARCCGSALRVVLRALRCKCAALCHACRALFEQVCIAVHCAPLCRGVHRGASRAIGNDRPVSQSGQTCPPLAPPAAAAKVPVAGVARDCRSSPMRPGAPSAKLAAPGRVRRGSLMTAATCRSPLGVQRRRLIARVPARVCVGKGDCLVVTLANACPHTCSRRLATCALQAARKARTLPSPNEQDRARRA